VPVVPDEGGTLMFGRKWKSVETSLLNVQQEIVSLRSEIDQRSADIASLRGTIQSLEERLGSTDARVVQITTELTNQLHEIDSELELLATTADAASAETVTELRANQVRIASEQARYAITLRQDLAELAELLRKART
jgi:chromosome segregation ATPase